MPDIPEAVAEQLGNLTAAVEQLREGTISREEVEQRVAEALAAQRTTPIAGGGYRPGDHAADEYRTLNGSFQERMAQIHGSDATSVSSLIRRTDGFVREFQQRADDVVILDAIMSQGGRLPYNVRESQYYQREFQPMLRAMDTQTAGEGQEWVPTIFSNELIRRVNLKLKVAALFRSITMPSQPFTLPALGVTRQRTGSHAEQTADTGQTAFKAVTPASRKVTLNAVKIAARILVSREEEEDAIVAVLPLIRDEIIDYLAADWEDTIVNGDTTGTHQDADVTASDDPRKLLNGLRKLAQAGQKVDVGNVALTVAKLRTVRKSMGKYGIDPNQLAYLASISSYVDLLSDPSVITIDKLGPNATILSGQLATVDGSPIIVSEYVRTNLNATGVYDGTTINRTETLIVRTDAYIIGERRGLTTQLLQEKYADFDQDELIASYRRAFQTLYPNATEPTVGIAYNSAS